jgi:hypothetical protein
LVYSQTEKLRILPNEPKYSSQNSTLRSGVDFFFFLKTQLFVQKTQQPCLAAELPNLPRNGTA